MRPGRTLFAILPVLFFTAGAHAQQTVAHVLDVTGVWHLDGSAAPIVAGSGLGVGARLIAASNHPGDAITLVRDDDMSRQRIVCDASTTNPCRAAITIAASVSDSPSVGSELKEMMAAAISVLLNKPPSSGNNYATTLSRGADTVRKSEAVVALDSSGDIRLPDPPADMHAGTYTVAIARAGDATPMAKQSLVLTSSGSWRPLPLATAGIYEISIVNTDEEPVADVMLLVNSAADYPEKRDQFETLKARADSWSGAGAADDEHTFLRAFLLSGSPQ